MNTSFIFNPPQAPIKLANTPTIIEPLYGNEKDYEDQLSVNIKKISKLQEKLYASNSHSLLIILQSADAAGKDGVIRHVFSGINPQGCSVTSFKHPVPKEHMHDFLWRTSMRLPERGMIGIFNRSYYEEVLTVKVHPEILKAQKIPYSGPSDEIWTHRYESINQHELHLNRNGTKIIKFYLHLSKEEQTKRLLKRIDRPEKNWKFADSDIEERKFWDQHMKAFEDCFQTTSTPHAPWHIIPSDDKFNSRLIISSIVLKTLEDLDLKFPETSDLREKELAGFKKRLQQDL